jgi:hypothetical protein
MPREGFGTASDLTLPTLKTQVRFLRELSLGRRVNGDRVNVEDVLLPRAASQLTDLDGRRRAQRRAV